MSPEAVKALLAKKPELQPSKAKLEAMQPGAYCIHRSWGFGQIDSYDAVDGKLVIHFEGKPSHRMDPVFCVNTLDVLPAAHVLVRRITEPAAVEKMIKESPAELLVQLLALCPNRAATQIEVENTLVRLMGAEQFKRWWPSAKKVIAKDSRVAVPAKKMEVFYLREEAVTAEADLMEQFKATRSARRKIEIAEQLWKAAQGNAELKGQLGPVLESLAGSIRESNQLGLHEKLHGAWVRDDIASLSGEDASAYEPTLNSLIEDTRQLVDLAERLPAHYQDHLLELIKDTHSDQWRELIIGLLKVSKGKFTSECINFLVEHECTEELAATFHRWQSEQNLKAPVLLWIAKNRHSRKYRTLLENLISPRLLSSIFSAIDAEALQGANARRIPLGDYLSDDADLIPDLLAGADAEIAKDLANQLIMNQGFEELTKKSLLARFIKLFPVVQQMVSGEAEQKEASLFVSKESYDRRRAELDELISRKIPENSRAIATAREHGDLRENSEYKMAKQDQSVLMARKAQLEADLGRAQITDFRDAPTEVVGIGSLVTVESAGQKQAYAILGAWDSDPERHIISYKTALGSALLGHKVGDIAPLKEGGASRDRELRIISITRWTESR